MIIQTMPYPAAAEDYANLLVYPLTYDETDKDGAYALTRSGGMAITPSGFEADGFQNRLKTTSLPAWLASSTNALSVNLRAKVWANTRHTTRDVLLSIGNDDATANPKLEIGIFDDDEMRNTPVFGLRTYNGSITTRYFGIANWRYGLRWPTVGLTANGETVRPQGLLFLDSDTILVSGHYNDTESRVYKIDLTDGTVLGSFTFGLSTYRHVAAWARRANGEVWCVDYETDDALEIDLDASFASGTAVINTTWNLSNLGTNVLTGIEFVTVSGTEYVLIALYIGSSTTWLYVIPTTQIADGATFAIANRHKRFVLGRQCQGITLRQSDGLLYLSHNTNSTSANTCPIDVANISAAITSTPDGGTLAILRTHQGPSQYPEDIKFHPTTNECWVGTEGRDAVIDNEGFLAYWRSPLTDNKPVERDIRIDYDGAGNWEFWLDGLFFDDLNGVSPTIMPGQISIGGPPAASAGWANGFALASIRSVAMKDSTFSAAELAALEAGTYEPNTLTAYNVTITNPGAESGTTGWTSESGGLSTRTSNPDPRYEEGVANTAYFFGGPNAATVARQRFSIATATGLSTGEIDSKIASGDLWATARWWQTNFDETADPGTMGIRYLNGTPTTLATNYGAVTFLGMNQYWMRRSLSAAANSGSRNIDILHRMDRTSGTNNDSYHDDVTLTIYAR
ncbi:hypothetical protein [Qipengyuania oceanensis]|uniref:Uncharacterized protein n=1 Tax=Qipengyuania oceanensis TaxID=1463597 RepID=A0A844YHK8_9SPHN|nr:hypothetical protein [Qipengyuania oceanensis]MXO63417.1 hypothetical protein [Qipengyuania oceanensis]